MSEVRIITRKGVASAFEAWSTYFTRYYTMSTLQICCTRMRAKALAALPKESVTYNQLYLV